MEVYLIIEAKSEDYHGTYKEVIGVYKNKDDALMKIKELEEDNSSCNTEYDYYTYNIE
jgi:hypothetical protein